MALATTRGVQFIRSGATRRVLLVGRFAFKVPSVAHGWRLLLCGLLANIQEAEFGTTGLDGFCPVVFAVPGGWMTVMRRADAMPRADWEQFCPEEFCRRDGYMIPAEAKIDSFGILGGQVVAIDYGN